MRICHYTPMLNVAEPVWNRLTWRRLRSVAPENATQLNEHVVRGLRAIQDDSQVLRDFWKPLPRAFPPGAVWERS